MAEYKYIVTSNTGDLAEKEFTNIKDALEYAKQTMDTFIYEYSVDADVEEADDFECVWSWDDIWDNDEEVISRIERGHSDMSDIEDDIDEAFKFSIEKDGDNTRVETSGDEAQELVNFARAILGDNFDVFNQDFADAVEVTDTTVEPAEFDYEIDAIKEVDADVDPFEDNLFSDEEEYGSEESLEPSEESTTKDSEEDDEDVPEGSKELVAEVEKTSAYETPKDMIGGRLVDAKDPMESEVEVEEDNKEEEVEEDPQPEPLEESISDDQFEKIESKLVEGADKMYSIDLEWDDEQDFFDISIVYDKKSESFQAYASVYHASEDNNAENVELHTDEEDYHAKSLKELYESLVDDFGKPFEDEFFREASNEHLLEKLLEASSVEKRAFKFGGEDVGDYLDGKAIAFEKKEVAMQKAGYDAEHEEQSALGECTTAEFVNESYEAKYFDPNKQYEILFHSGKTEVVNGDEAETIAIEADDWDRDDDISQIYELNEDGSLGITVWTEEEGFDVSESLKKKNIKEAADLRNFPNPNQKLQGDLETALEADKEYRMDLYDLDAEEVEARINAAIATGDFDEDEWPEPEDLDSLPKEGGEIPLSSDEDAPVEDIDKVADRISNAEDTWDDDMSDEEFAEAFSKALADKKRLKEEDDQEELVEHVNEETDPIESDQELQGTDNAVNACKVNKVITHADDEKPLNENK